MHRELHDGTHDGLTPLEPIDLSKVRSAADLLRAMGRTAFGGRKLGEALEVMLAMARDPDCKIIVTLSGAMTIAKMGRVLCDMIEHGLAHYIISTGALLAHGLSENVGGTHFKHDPGLDDNKLYMWGYNRVYDTLELEQNLQHTEDLLGEVLDEMDPDVTLCSHMLNRAIGKKLIDKQMMPSVLGIAHQYGVPVYVPAFTDSEIALGVAAHLIGKSLNSDPAPTSDKLYTAVPPFNPFLDLYDFSRRLGKAKTLGIFTIGGGVPRNWGQQIAPFIEILNIRSNLKLHVPRITYAVRICPEPVHWGGLSGCTYNEGVSWGKFKSRAEGGRFAEVLADATIAWPLLMKGVLEELGKEK